MQFIVQGFPAFAYTGGRPFAAKAPAVAFVHGAAFDHSVWQWQSRYFAHHGLTVLAPDLPGQGRSPGAMPATVEALAQWLAALLDAAGLERASLVGHSLGSLAALQLAIAHPQRVERLALLGTSLPMAVGAPFLAAAADHDPAALDMSATWCHSRQVQLAASPVPGASLLAASRRLNGRSRAGVLHAGLAACAAYAPAPGALAALRLPALVLGGTRDQMTPAARGAAVAAAIPGARFQAVPAGHSMMVEAPREVTAALREFLHA